MVKSDQLAVELLCEELKLSREAILKDFRAEMSTHQLEQRQEIKAVPQVTAEQVDIAHSLTRGFKARG